MAIICASLPTLRPLAAFVTPKISTAFSSIQQYSWGLSKSGPQSMQSSLQSSKGHSHRGTAHRKEEDEVGFANGGLCPACRTNVVELSQNARASEDSGVKESEAGQIKVTTMLDQQVAEKKDRP
jgi:hypothetical protein